MELKRVFVIFLRLCVYSEEAGMSSVRHADVPAGTPASLRFSLMTAKKKNKANKMTLMRRFLLQSELALAVAAVASHLSV